MMTTTCPIVSFDQIRSLALQKAELTGRLKVVTLSGINAVGVEGLRQGVHDGLIEVVSIEYNRYSAGGLKQVTEQAVRGDVDLIVAPESDILSQLDDLKAGSTPGHIVLLHMDRYNKLLMVADATIWTDPALDTKTRLAEHMVRLGRSYGLREPKIAALAAVEVVYPQMQVTLDGAELALLSRQGHFGKGQVEGPLSVDVATDLEAARAKGVIESQVAGQADGFLAPSREVARGIWESAVVHGGAEYGGFIVADPCPILPISSLDTAQALYNSLCLTRLYRD